MSYFYLISLLALVYQSDQRQVAIWLSILNSIVGLSIHVLQGAQILGIF